MTVYVHFIDRATTPVRLFNVSVVEYIGDGEVRVVNLFGGEPREFSGVRNVACEITAAK